MALGVYADTAATPSPCKATFSLQEPVLGDPSPANSGVKCALPNAKLHPSLQI